MIKTQINLTFFNKMFLNKKQILYNFIKGTKKMKIVYVVDSATDLKHKINLLENKIPCEMLFVVRADLVPLFETYGYKANAVYYNNLSKVMQHLLLRSQIDDTIICYASLKLDNTLLTQFTAKIGNKTHFVNLVPYYNIFEQVCNSAYNVYVKSLFKSHDSLISAKLQFVPMAIMFDLLTSHISNRMFEIEPEYQQEIQVQDKEINKTAKSKSGALKLWLLCLIITLSLTAGMLAAIAYATTNFLVILLFVVLYLLNFILSIIFACKRKFDNRFLK